jgi:hypothetical protein
MGENCESVTAALGHVWIGATSYRTKYLALTASIA